MDRRSFLQLGSTIGLALGFGGRVSDRILERVEDSSVPGTQLSEFITEIPQVVDDVVKLSVPSPLEVSQNDVPGQIPFGLDWSKALETYLDPSIQVIDVGPGADYVAFYPEVMRGVDGEELSVSVTHHKMEHLYLSFVIRDDELFERTPDQLVNMYFDPALRTLAQWFKDHKHVWVSELPAYNRCAGGLRWEVSRGGRIPLRVAFMYDHQRAGHKVYIDLKAATRNPLDV